MTISKIDLISLVVLVIFAWRGYRKGAMNMIVSLVGLIVSFFVPWLIAPWLTEQLMKIPVIEKSLLSLFGNLGTEQAAGKIFEIIVFVLLLLVMILLIGRIKKWIRGANKLPVIGTLNRLTGACIAVIAAGLVITAIVGGLYYIAQWTGNVSLQGSLLSSSFLSLFLCIMN